MNNSLQTCLKFKKQERQEELEKKGFRLQFRKNGELINIQEEYEKLYDLSELTKAEQNILEAFSAFPYIPLAADTCDQWLLSDARVSEDDDILILLPICRTDRRGCQYAKDTAHYYSHNV